jgi:hypothetical protein
MVRPNLTLEAEAGYVVYRSWDFFDQHINPTVTLYLPATHLSRPVLMRTKSGLS